MYGIKFWQSQRFLWARVQLSLIFGDLKRFTEQIKCRSNKIKILRILSYPTPLKKYRFSCKHGFTARNTAMIIAVTSPRALLYDSTLGRIQLAGTHCGSSCALLTAVSSWTQESCSSSLTITWSKNCQYWDSIFRAASSISWKSSSWWRKQRVRRSGGNSVCVWICLNLN